MTASAARPFSALACCGCPPFQPAAADPKAAALTRTLADRDAAVAEADRLRSALRGAEEALAATLGAAGSGGDGALRANAAELERRNGELLQELRAVRRREGGG